MSGALQLAAGAALALAAWLIPRRVAGRRHRLPAGGSARSRTGAAGRGSAADRDRAAGFCRPRPVLARRRLRARRPRPSARRCASRWSFPTCPSCRMSSPIRSSICRLPGRAWSSAGRSRRSLSASRCSVSNRRLWRRRSGCSRSRGGRAVVGRGWVMSREPALGAGGRHAAAARSDRRAVRRRGEARPVCDAARLRHYRAGRARRRAAPGMRRLPAPVLRRRRPRRRCRWCWCNASRFSTRAACRRCAATICCPASTPAAEQGATFGRLDVAGWGANTMRAEFAVLTGIPEAGSRLRPVQPLSRLCPRADRLARLAAARRGLPHAMPAPVRPRLFPPRSDHAGARLRDAFSAAKPWAARAGRPIAPTPIWPAGCCVCSTRRGPRTFIFVITMGNHGPWLESGPAIDPDLRRRFDPAGLPQGGELLRYLDGLARSDAMLQILLGRPGADAGATALFGFYGDHLPSLPHAFRTFRLRRMGERLCAAGRRGAVARSGSTCRRIACRR